MKINQENQSLSNHLQRNYFNEQFERLYKFANLFNASLKPEEVIERATEAVSRILPCDSVTLEFGGSSGSIRDERVLIIPLIIKTKQLGTLVARNREKIFTREDEQLLHILAPQIAIAFENATLHSQLKKNFYDTVEALVEAVEKKDRYTGGHTKRVVHYSVLISKHLHLSEEELERVKLGALLHDVGKIGVEDKILKKDSPLEPCEWEVMQEHPQMGYEIMSRVEGLKDVIAGMRYHHERYDGLGYPEGLKGEEIPLVARIIAVADTYDAMVSTRPYRKGLPTEKAFAEIVKYSGTQFDPKVVDAFVKAFKKS